MQKRLNSVRETGKRKIEDSMDFIAVEASFFSSSFQIFIILPSVDLKGL